MAHTVDHDQLRSWNRLCGRLPAAHSNELVLSTVNNKGRQVEPVQVFGTVWCGHGRRQLTYDAFRIERAVEGPRRSVAQLGLVDPICRRADSRSKSTERSMAPANVLTGGNRNRARAASVGWPTRPFPVIDMIEVRLRDSFRA